MIFARFIHAAENDELATTGGFDDLKADRLSFSIESSSGMGQLYSFAWDDVPLVISWRGWFRHRTRNAVIQVHNISGLIR